MIIMRESEINNKDCLMTLKRDICSSVGVFSSDDYTSFDG